MIMRDTRGLLHAGNAAYCGVDQCGVGYFCLKKNLEQFKIINSKTLRLMEKSRGREVISAFFNRE